MLLCQIQTIMVFVMARSGARAPSCAGPDRTKAYENQNQNLPDLRC